MSIAHKSKDNMAIFHALHQSAIGIDVHSNLIVAVFQKGEFGKDCLEGDTWNGTASKSELIRFAKWCKRKSPEVLIMESTGVYWQSLYEALEDEGFKQTQIIVVNARDVKNRRGSKTDLSDAIHLAEIARQGSYRASFVPAKYVRQLRCLWRSYATLKNTRKRLLNILHKQLCQVGCRASSVFSDIRGKTASKILECLISGQNGKSLRQSIVSIIKSSKGKLRSTPAMIYEALQADMNSLVWYSIRKHLTHIKFIDVQLKEAEENLRSNLTPYQRLLSLLSTIPAIKEITSIGIVCELGDDLSQFTSIRKFAKWIGLAPGNNESAGKRYSGRTTPGNKYLKVLLIEAASGIGLMKSGYLHEVHQKLKERRGTKKANVAIAHKLCRIIFNIITQGTCYIEQDKPILKDHRLAKATNALAGLKEVGLECNDVEVLDSSNGEIKVIHKAKKENKQDSFCSC
jgi:transposase